MPDLIKILIAFAGILILLHRKINIGTAMGIGAVLIALLYRFSLGKFLSMAGSVLTDPKMLEITLTLYLIMVLEHVLRTTGKLDKMAAKVATFIGDERIAISVMPALIGLLPSPGGARFSAPMVEAISTNQNADCKAFINYWFRHLWEYVSPLYPGILLVASFLDIPVGSFVVYMIPFPFLMLIPGYFIAFNCLETTKQKKHASGGLFSAIRSLWPIILVIMIVVILKTPVSLSLLITLLILFLVEKYPVKDIRNTVMESFSSSILILILGIFLFKESLQVSGALESITAFPPHIPAEIIIFALPFITGLLTGVTVAFVGISFPVLITLNGGTQDINTFVLAFAAGFSGVMLSPVHLCLILTKDYFNSEMLKIYKLLLPASAFVTISGLIYYLLLKLL